MSMVSHFAFEIQPVAVRQLYTKGNDFADHYLAHGIEVAAAFGKIGDLRGVSLLATMPYRIQIDA